MYSLDIIFKVIVEVGVGFKISVWSIWGIELVESYGDEKIYFFRGLEIF